MTVHSSTFAASLDGLPFVAVLKAIGGWRQFWTEVMEDLQFERQWARQERRRIKRLQRGFTYESRSHVLKGLGFSSYQEYLRSPLWRRIRARVFAYKGRICWLCPSPAVAIHHTQYHRKDLLGLRLKNVFPICDSCHEKIEFTLKGSKNDLSAARGKFLEKERARTNHVAWLLLNHDADQ